MVTILWLFSVCGAFFVVPAFMESMLFIKKEEDLPIKQMIFLSLYFFALVFSLLYEG